MATGLRHVTGHVVLFTSRCVGRCNKHVKRFIADSFDDVWPVVTLAAGCLLRSEVMQQHFQTDLSSFAYSEC